jgi:carboxymethylenebutenolidase
MTDTRAAVARLREADATAIFTVGFCFGGSASWRAAADVDGLAGAVGFYGRPTRVEDRVAAIRAPVLALQAGDDANITADDNEMFERALTEAGVEHEVVTYDGAPHSFFDRKHEEFADASEDAWRRVLAFIEQHSAARV